MAIHLADIARSKGCGTLAKRLTMFLFIVKKEHTTHMHFGTDIIAASSGKHERLSQPTQLSNLIDSHANMGSKAYLGFVRVLPLPNKSQ